MKNPKNLDVKRVIDHVALLLQEIPSSLEVVKDDKNKEQRFHYLAKYMVKKALRNNALIVSEDYTGIAILFEMKNFKEGFWQTLKDDLILAFKVTGLRKGWKGLQTQKIVRKARPQLDNYLYCWFWGILKDSRGVTSQKLAYSMKDEFYEIARQKKLPLFAETRTRRISIAYQRYGFQVVKKWEHPSGDTMYFLRYDTPRNK
ncbi:MAG: hypothetical protein LAT51_07745 [Flavobacteriaceae bacterium]|nr:hypothetical protein [Flavobacteriaceae bacterium]